MAANFKKFKLMTDEELERQQQKLIAQYDPKLRTMARLKEEMDAVLTSNGAASPEQKMALLLTLRDHYNSLGHVSQAATLPAFDSHFPKPAEVPAVVPAAPRGEELDVRPATPPPPRSWEPASFAVEPSTSAAARKGAETPATTGEKKKAKRPAKSSVGEVELRSTPPAEASAPAISLKSQIPKSSMPQATQLLTHLHEHPEILNVSPYGELVLGGKTVPQSSASDLFLHLFSRKQGLSEQAGKSKLFRALAALKIPSSLITNPEARRAYEPYVKASPSLTYVPPGDPSTPHILRLFK